MKPLDPRLLRWARATRWFLLASVLAGVVTTATIIAQAVLLATIITRVFQAGATLADVWPQVTYLAGVIVLRSILAFLLEWVAFHSSARAKSQLRMAVLDHMVALGPQYLESRGSGELTQLTGRGIDALDAYFARYLPQLVLAVMVPIAIIVTVITEDLLAAVIIALTIPLIPIFMILVGLYTDRQVTRQWRTLSILAGHFLDVVAGLPTLKMFGRARAQAATLRDIGDRYRRATMGVLRVSFLSALVLELLATLSVAIVAVAIGLRLVNGTIDLYTGLVVLILAPEAYLPLRMVGAQFHAAADGVAAAEQLLDILEEPVPHHRGTQRIDRRLDRPTVTATHLTVHFPGRPAPALDDFSIVAEPGSITALAGESGAGKSTALRALLGLIDAESGTVALRSGPVLHAMADTEPRDWLDQFGWVPQEPVMVAGTVADNIALGRSGASATDIARAAERAGLAEPGVLTQHVSDGGGGVSAGQRRRIGMARVILRAAPIVLLDEPSAALDEATESLVVTAVNELRTQGHTVIVVAHRPALLEIADQTITLRAPDPDALIPADPTLVLPGLSR
mgnify:CR=1 FL=1